MCGIISIKRLDGHAPHKMLHKRYQMQKSRGTEGFGFVMLKGSKIVAYERAETEADIMDRLDQLQGDEVIFHHRFPTSTENLMEAAHPIKVSHESLKHDYYLIHNGIIRNPEAWKDIHEKEGFTYNTRIAVEKRTWHRSIFISDEFNDSEALAIELAKDLDKQGNGINVSGSIAFVMLQADKEGNATRLFWGRNDGYPLKINELKKVFRTIASEGNGILVPENKLYEFDYTRKTVSCRDYAVGVHTPMGFTNYQSYNSYTDSTDLVNETDNIKYFQLLEKYDNLRRSYEDLLLQGVDDQKILADLDDVEALIADMEAEFDDTKLAIVNTK